MEIELKIKHSVLVLFIRILEDGLSFSPFRIVMYFVFLRVVFMTR
jgi:hypothetical protein